MFSFLKLLEITNDFVNVGSNEIIHKENENVLFIIAYISVTLSKVLYF